MPQKETTNIILRLKREGWDGDKINEFLVYIETHIPTEEEGISAFRKELSRNNLSRLRRMGLQRLGGGRSRCGHRRLTAHEVQWTSDLRGPERSVDQRRICESRPARCQVYSVTVPKDS